MTSNASFHCELAWLGGETASADVVIEVAGERIVAVTPDSKAPPNAVRLRGLTLPGVANAHSHAFHRALRGRTHGDGGTFWTWRQQMYAVAARLDPDRYLALARAVYAEMALAGITVVGEFHYLHHGPGGIPYADPNAMAAALVQAASDAGVRLTVSGGTFADVETGVDPHPGDQRLPGVVLPGLANAHSHAFHRALRGRTSGDGGTFWTWREQMYAVAARLDPDRYLALARATYAEMALAGVTCVGEFHYLHHPPGGGRRRCAAHAARRVLPVRRAGRRRAPRDRRRPDPVRRRRRR